VAVADPLSTCTDEDLLARYRKGQTEAFGVLVGRYERELYGYLRRYLGDGNLADDVFQNTFLQLVVKINQYEPGRPVRPWLYTIATNQAIDALRRQSRHQALSLNHYRDESANGEAQSLMDGLETLAPDPSDLADDQELHERVRASVDGLPDFLKQVLIMAYYQGLKYREIADILGIPVGTVKSRLHAALVRLHEMWEKTPSLYEA
jgi:RNA polymerase sigma-70 factor (ECF subfamily)